jgi:hypothetical protein
MLFWLAAAAAVATVIPAPTPAHSNRDLSTVAAEARATVRIISGVRVKLGPGESKQDQSDGVPPPHNAVIVADGTARPARLIEFE